MKNLVWIEEYAKDDAYPFADYEGTGARLWATSTSYGFRIVSGTAQYGNRSFTCFALFQRNECFCQRDTVDECIQRANEIAEEQARDS